MIDMFMRTRPHHLHGKPVVFTVFLGPRRRRSIAGKTCEAHGRRLPLRWLLPILEHAIVASVRVVGDRVVRQVRGAFIGSPLSPAWCSLVLMWAEYQWRSSLQSTQPSFGELWTAVRYVDNRLTMCVAAEGSNHPRGSDRLGHEVASMLLDVDNVFTQVLSPHFYGSPIELEPEEHLDIVGVRISIDGVSIQGSYIVHGFEELFMQNGRLVLPLEHRWRYRSAQSAGSSSSLLVGFKTRAHQALRLSFPLVRARRSLAQQVAVSLALGLAEGDLVQAVVSLRRRFPRALPEQFCHSLIHAVRNHDVRQVLSMGE